MSDDERARRRDQRIGLFYMLGAYAFWGVALPVYLKALKGVPVLEILAHRVVWATVFALLLIAVPGRIGEMRRVLAPRTLRLLLISAALVTANWVIYIVAVTSDHIVDASLGYFMNPLVSVALGMAVLGEKLRRLQTAACIAAAAGVALLTASSGGMPWISLGLAFSFGLYGLVRKVVAVEALVGFTFEAMLLTPLAVGYLLFLAVRGEGSFAAATPLHDALLVGAGIVTALPLIWFAAGARKLPLTVVGVLQFLSPCGTLLLGVFVYGEPFGGVQAVCFAAIWLALVLYLADALGVRGRRRFRPPRALQPPGQ
jgi:chloramphenicol-sensitive protein RarD